MGFFQIFVLRFEFGSKCSHSARWDIRIWAQVTGDDEVVTIACGVKIILHHEAKMSFSPPHRYWRLQVHFGCFVVVLFACWHM